jgi:periplasmic protein TonB
VAYIVHAPKPKSDRMSPTALVLALALHGLAAAGLWWASSQRPTEPPQYAIVVTFDSGTPAGSTASQPLDKPVPPATAGAPDPAASGPEQPPDPSQRALTPTQPPQPPQPEPVPQPNLEQALALPQEPPPPTTLDFPKTFPAKVRPAPAPPPRRAQSPPPSPRPPQTARVRPPSNAASSATSVPSNSSDWLVGTSRARNAYLDRVARHTAPYRHYPRAALDNKQEGRVVTRVTISRDGGLIDARIDRSSGWPAIDAAELATIRKSAPLPPVPNDMPGDPVILILPIIYDLSFAARNR